MLKLKSFAELPPDVTVDFWTCVDDAEDLVHSHEDDAIEGYLDDIGPWPGDEPDPNVRLAKFLAAVGETLTVYGHRRVVLPDDFPVADDLVERVLEDLDDEHYGDPDEATKPTPAMLEAAKTFLAKIRAEYFVWQCEEVVEVEIDPREWMRANRPEWLEVIA